MIFDVYYFFIKIVFFFALVRAQIKSDLLREHYLFLAIVYTAAVTFLSWIFIVGPGNEHVPLRPPEILLSRLTGLTEWRVWLGETLVLSVVYFKLMAKFDEGVIFWTLLLLGIPLALF
jgi:hypothetical protein